MYLADTNIFLEVLLAQEKSKECKDFLEENLGELAISDFSLHSIGVILFRNKKENVFIQFVNDVLAKLELQTLGNESYRGLSGISTEFKLDFDDAYQVQVAQENSLTIVTMDRDFDKVKSSLPIVFL